MLSQLISYLKENKHPMESSDKAFKKYCASYITKRTYSRTLNNPYGAYRKT